MERGSVPHKNIQPNRGPEPYRYMIQTDEERVSKLGEEAGEGVISSDTKAF